MSDITKKIIVGIVLFCVVFLCTLLCIYLVHLIAPGAPTIIFCLAITIWAYLDIVFDLFERGKR